MKTSALLVPEHASGGENPGDRLAVSDSAIGSHVDRHRKGNQFDHHVLLFESVQPLWHRREITGQKDVLELVAEAWRVVKIEEVVEATRSATDLLLQFPHHRLLRRFTGDIKLSRRNLPEMQVDRGPILVDQEDLIIFDRHR
jgi:hypothetical protein